MHELQFILAVFSRFLSQTSRKINGYHLLLGFKDDTIITQANQMVLKDYNLEGKVTVLSELNSSDRALLLKKTQILFYPFQRRSFDHNMVKAMSIGCPVMASNTGAALEIIQNGMTGFLLPQDIGMWTQKLNDLFINNLGNSMHAISLQDISINGKARVRNLFS